MAKEPKVDVPTREEFDALAARVDDHETRIAALEAGTVTPPDPIPPDPGPDPNPPGGVQAKRIADLVELFGVNTFSSLDNGNVWGSWPADYRPDSVVEALGWITNGSGFALRVREYHYAGREAMQVPWLRQVVAAIPGTRVTLCVAANGSARDVPSMVAMQADPTCGVEWIEGLNEPNTNFGSGEVPYAETEAIQDACWTQTAQRGSVMGPSIVAGTPHPEGWIQGYCGTQQNLDVLNASMSAGNGHYYPPGSPDAPNTGYSINEYIGGLWGAYAQHPIHLTEYHPTLYNSQGHKPDQPGWSGARDAYYTLTTLLRCSANGTMGLWWYALFDYGTVYRCGLFPKDHANDPREDAYGLRALCTLAADPGADRRTFEPGALAYAVEGGDEATSHALYEASDGTFFVALWRSLTEPGGDAIPVRVAFPGGVRQVEEYDLTAIAAAKRGNNYPIVQTARDRDEVTVQLDGGARLLIVAP